MIRNSRVLVTGASGFLGGYVVHELRRYAPDTIHTVPSDPYDLRDRHTVRRAFDVSQPDIVIHLAAIVGGIEANRRSPGSIFYDNATMGLNVIDQCCESRVKKVLTIGTICSYPKFTPVPFRETDLWNGYPEETNAPYGLAKKMLLVQGQAYRQQYGLNAIHLLMVNLYGPGDNTNPVTSHVIPALIRKVLDAKRTNAPFVECWGTGNASREFLYVEDAARAICLAADRYNGAEPVNVGSGVEVSIRKLAEIICNLIGYKGELRWNSDRPDGQPRRCLSVSRAKDEFDFESKVGLGEGLVRTIEWMEKL